GHRAVPRQDRGLQGAEGREVRRRRGAATQHQRQDQAARARGPACRRAGARRRRSLSSYIVGIGETARVRHPDPSQTTLTFMRDAALAAMHDAGMRLQDIDGLAVASFALEPDRAVDVAWRLGLSVRWLLQDTNGGASAINMLGHAINGIQ